MWAGRLFLAPGMFLYLGAGASAESHAHHAVQLIWARDGKLELELPSGAVRVGAALLPANSEHALQAEGQIALLLVEPHGGRGAEFHHLRPSRCVLGPGRCAFRRRYR